MSRARLNVFLEYEHAKRLDELATMKGLSKSSIIAAALASFLSPDGGDRREAAIARRLDQLTRQFDKLERDQNILIETVALYVRYYLSVSLPVPEAHQEAARAQGRGSLRAIRPAARAASAARQQPGAAKCTKKSFRTRANSSGTSRLRQRRSGGAASRERWPCSSRTTRPSLPAIAARACCARPWVR